MPYPDNVAMATEVEEIVRAHGAVPVASRVGHTAWVMEGTEAGVLFDLDAGALADALRELLTDPERLRNMSERGRRHLPSLSLETFERRLGEVLAARFGP